RCEGEAMTEAETLAWYERLAKGVQDGAGGDIAEWITDAESALASVFPSGHTVRTSWAAARKRAQGNPRYIGFPNPEERTIAEFVGIFKSAQRQLKEGHLRTLAEGVRAETVAEC